MRFCTCNNFDYYEKNVTTESVVNVYAPLSGCHLRSQNKIKRERVENNKSISKRRTSNNYYYCIGIIRENKQCCDHQYAANKRTLLIRFSDA